MNYRSVIAACWCLFTISSSLIAQSEQEAGFGPSHQGLCLQLTTKYLGGEKSENQLEVKLVNRGKEDFVLKTRFYYNDGESFREFFEQSLFFTSFPETVPSSFSTAGEARTKPQVAFTLKPGESLTLRKKANSGFIDGGSLSHHRLRLVRDGKYFVRAQVQLYDSRDQPFRLWSNEGVFVVGNSKKHPSAGTAKILRYKKDGEKNVASLNVGMAQGIKPGDEFAHWAKAGSFLYRVTTVNRSSCLAEVVRVKTRVKRELELPPSGTELSYERTIDNEIDKENNKQ